MLFAKWLLILGFPGFNILHEPKNAWKKLGAPDFFSKI
jgi:hypothetical protein